MRQLVSHLQGKVARLDKGIKNVRSYQARRSLQLERERTLDYLRVVREYSGKREVKR